MGYWNADKIGDLSGKKVIVTGGSSGIGFETASHLAFHGADVTLAVRNLEKGREAASRIGSVKDAGRVTAMELDLADLSSVKGFTDQVMNDFERLDILVNNAGVMMPPFKKTADGFELQMGTNHFGHFALTAQLMPLLLGTPLSRVVTVSSIASRKAKIDFGNLDGLKGYNAFRFYRQSKLSNLLFALELQNRLDHNGHSTISLACHPGIAATNVISRGSGKEAPLLIRRLMRIVAQTSYRGALPLLFAAIAPDLRGGEYIAPDGYRNHKGYPVLSDEGARLFDKQAAIKLWEISEKLTGVRYDL